MKCYTLDLDSVVRGTTYNGGEVVRALAFNTKVAGAILSKKFSNPALSNPALCLHFHH